jgi:hypothetical protein
LAAEEVEELAIHLLAALARNGAGTGKVEGSVGTTALHSIGRARMDRGDLCMKKTTREYIESCGCSSRNRKDKKSKQSYSTFDRGNSVSKIDYWGEMAIGENEYERKKKEGLAKNCHKGRDCEILFIKNAFLNEHSRRCEDGREKK